VSILAENHIQKRIQTPQAIKSSLATSEQAGKNLGDDDVYLHNSRVLLYLLFTVIFWSLQFGDFKIIRFVFFLDLFESNPISNLKF